MAISHKDGFRALLPKVCVLSVFHVVTLTTLGSFRRPWVVKSMSCYGFSGLTFDSFMIEFYLRTGQAMQIDATEIHQCHWLLYLVLPDWQWVVHRRTVRKTNPNNRSFRCLVRNLFSILHKWTLATFKNSSAKRQLVLASKKCDKFWLSTFHTYRLTQVKYRHV